MDANNIHHLSDEIDQLEIEDPTIFDLISISSHSSTTSSASSGESNHKKSTIGDVLQLLSKDGTEHEDAPEDDEEIFSEDTYSNDQSKDIQLLILQEQLLLTTASKLEDHINSIESQIRDQFKSTDKDFVGKSNSSEQQLLPSITKPSKSLSNAKRPILPLKTEKSKMFPYSLLIDTFPKVAITLVIIGLISLAISYFDYSNIKLINEWSLFHVQPPQNSTATF